MKKIGLIFFLVFSLNVLSQEAPVKWKEISMQDLQMKEFANDTSASAIILCDYGTRYFDVNPNGKNLFFFNERHVRIKILKPEGLKFAHIRIPYKDMACEAFPEELSMVIKGITYNLDEKGEVIASRLKTKNIKRMDSINCLKVAEFDLPNVVPGSIIEYKYTMPMLDLVMPETWYFQNEIPTLYSEFRIRIPSQFSYLISPQNITNFDINEESSFNRSIAISPSYFYPYRYRIMPVFNLSGKQIRLVKTETEKFANPDFTNNPSDLKQGIKIHLSQATRENMDFYWERLTRALAITTVENYDSYEPYHRRLIFYPVPYVFYELPDWGTFNQKLIASDRFVLALIKHWDYEAILKEIVKDKESPEQKMIAVYDYMRKNIKWNGEYSIYVDPVFNINLSKLYSRVTNKLGNEKSLRKPFETKEGTSSEINFLLIYLLNKAGIETRPVIISTKEHGLIDTVIPEQKQFNHVVALAQIGENKMFLDATDSLRPYQFIGKNHLTPLGFLVKNNGFEWLNVENKPLSLSAVNEQIEIDKDLNYSTKLRISEDGYFALDHRKEIFAEGKGSFNKNQKEKLLLAQYQDFEILNLENINDSLIYQTSFSGHTAISGEVRIKPKLDPIYSASDFNDMERKYPVNFPFPFKKTYELELLVPDGFTVELPKSLVYKTYGDMVVFSYETKYEGNKIWFSISFEMKTADFPASEYNTLKQLFFEIDEKMAEEIIVKKTGN